MEAGHVQVYFHCTTGEAVLVDRGGTDVDDLTDAHDRAVQFVGSLIATPGGKTGATGSCMSATRMARRFPDAVLSVLGALH